MALPIIMLRKLTMKTREKIGLCVIFALVLIDVCFAILRVVFTLATIFSKAMDENTLWASLDPIIAVLVCTLPCYRKMISADRAMSIIRTANLSFDSNRFASIFKMVSIDDKKSTSRSTEMDEFSRHGSTDRLPPYETTSV
jgi:hypothetical protein